jgi:hypothetical protein
LAALAFDGGDERGFLAAYKGAGAQPDFDGEIEVGAADAVAQQPAFRACLMAPWMRLTASGYSARM